jgi:diguanylate cyclase (GGDEF)-like protein
MPKNTILLAAFNRSDSIVLDRLAKVQRVCLGIVFLISITTLCAWIITALRSTLPAGWTLMKFNTAVVSLASATSLTLSEPHRSRRSLILSRALAILVALVAAAALLEHAFGISLGVDTLIAADSSSHHPGLMSPQAGSSFVLLAVVLFFIRARKGALRHVVDFAVASLSLLVLIVVSGYLFGATSPFRVAASNWTSPQTLISLILLSFVAFGRRAENGAFAILVGGGIGSRTARILTPILLVLPFLREVGRVRLINNRLLPEHYTSAILASTAAMLSLGMLLILAWRINSMEREIHDLSFRDELTGLYNLRGFRLLAEQALRLAQRSQLPFSVLFVDLDDLKRINDSMGHDVGSAFLVETGNLLRTIFRQTDVVGRIGGDEFAVAGQFSPAGISVAAGRLEEKSGSAAAQATRALPLRLSIGYVTTEPGRAETLEDLLTKADTAMYEQKRTKKLRIN